ncbi:DNA polymerase III subunit beta [Bradyrhizobium sp. SZCCHNRI1002]|uniref:DNA polymerase III subunit beta n=1 Tax=Bradyrhizobium sp. SZCCHNRI1002 TaxID=3057274 RepID=UPI0028E99B43|nr:DNA polymerase III subunit beta [Bradyrhizobium sp. SZCCHNRI1002]
MRLTLPATGLSAGLALVMAAMPSGKQRLVRLAARESAAAIIGTDHAAAEDQKAKVQTMSVEISIAATVESAGEVVLDAGRLAGIADHASGDLIMSATDINVSIAAGKGRYRLPVLPDPPPALVLDNEEASITITAQDLRRLLEPAACAGRESSRFYLQGICLLSGADGLASVATDGVRLLRTSVAADRFSDDRKLIIPSKSVAAIEKLIKRESGMLTLRRNSRLLSIAGSGFTVITKLIDFTYPDLTSVLPAASSDAAVVRRLDLANGLARLMAAADGEAPLLAIEWAEPGPLHLYLARQPENSDLVDGATAGAALIAVAPHALARLVDEFRGEQLRIEITNRLAIRGDGKLGVVASSQWNFTPRASPGAGRTRPPKSADRQKENANAHV